ncbi:DUF4440 domain-containing protein [Jeotgalicoccus halotolerans]|uniref:nuclear transport factor 2 family protein n=1 Tax=Jeotgalicoccus halotolerans TaxID=157227 RepID=UPI003518C7C1
MIEYELYHLDRENRKSGQYLKFLHPEFKEFGQSGKVYRKEDLPKKFIDSSEYEIMEFMFQDLSIESRLCTYVLHNKTANKVSHRSSVWIRHGDDWKLLFHQGTSTADKNL